MSKGRGTAMAFQHHELVFSGKLDPHLQHWQFLSRALHPLRLVCTSMSLYGNAVVWGNRKAEAEAQLDSVTVQGLLLLGSKVPPLPYLLRGTSKLVRSGGGSSLAGHTGVFLRV